jgi:CRISPR system Cascade subunit CasC
MAFAEGQPTADQATRTKKISRLVTDRLKARSGIEEEQAVRLTTHLLKPLGIKAGKKESDTAYLLFLGRPQLDRIVGRIADRAQELAQLDDSALDEALKNEPVQNLLNEGHPIDVALFGRMVADLPNLNVDAAVQVAHALSTHPVEIEFDYYTAVDDENPKEETGAGMIGTVEFNSATLYRYATVAVPQLVENLGGDGDAALDALDRFIYGFTRSIPSGHQNSFAHRTLPSLVTVAVRTDQPVNLVSAFERPVRSSDGLAARSAQQFAEELRKVNERWASPAAHLASTYDDSAEDPSGVLRDVLGEPVSFPALQASVRSQVQALQGAEQA